MCTLPQMFSQPMAGQLVMVLPLDCSIPGPFENLQHVGQGKCLPCLLDHLQAKPETVFKLVCLQLKHGDALYVQTGKVCLQIRWVAALIEKVCTQTGNRCV